MNKTVTANISGIIFNIEEEAYQKLSQYLNTIRTYFKNSEGDEEIMADIESRIAELFQEKVSDAKQVIVMKDVEDVVEIMGQPEEYIDPDLEPNETFAADNEPVKNKTRRLFRDDENNIIGGVCAGISAHFGWDPIWIRLLFVGMFFMGMGILLYIILWVIIPAAKTTAEKLEMQGDPVNIENIKSHIKDNVNTKEAERKARGFFHSFFAALGVFFTKFFEVFGRILGIAFIAIGLCMLYALILFWFGSDSFVAFTDDGVSSINFEQFLNAIFPDEDYVFWAYVGATLVVGVPVLAFLYTGFKLVLDIRQSYKGVAISFVSIWILGLMICGFVAMQTVANFGTGEEDVTEVIEIEQPFSDTLYVEAAPDIHFSDHYDLYDNEMELIKMNDDQIIFGYPELDIRTSYDTLYHIEITKESCGRTIKDAKDRCENIVYNFIQSDSLLVFDPYYTSPITDQWRCQAVTVIVYVPEGKAIYLAESSDRIIYNIDNVHRMDDRKMPKHTWKMTAMGLTCTDCGF